MHERERESERKRKKHFPQGSVTLFLSPFLQSTRILGVCTHAQYAFKPTRMGSQASVCGFQLHSRIHYQLHHRSWASLSNILILLLDMLVTDLFISNFPNFMSNLFPITNSAFITSIFFPICGVGENQVARKTHASLPKKYQCISKIEEASPATK